MHAIRSKYDDNEEEEEETELLIEKYIQIFKSDYD
jgi:hypothetical protein